MLSAIRRTKSSAHAALLASAGMLSGCMSLSAGPDGRYAKPIGDAPVIENPTPYSAALTCLSQYSDRLGARRPHIAVGPLRDMTGQIDTNGGRPLTQGAMLMAISALGKAGIPLVERYETDVPKLEFDLANNKLISDEPKRDDSQRRDYRAIFPGSVTGSDFFLAGGITELNTSIRSVNISAKLGTEGRSAASSEPAANAFVMNIGMDLRLVDTTSLDIVDFVSYQKQIIGWQVGAGLFSFFGDQVLSVEAKTSADEPAQFAVRALVERAVVQFVSKLHRIPIATCLPDNADPMKGGDRRVTRDATPVPQQAQQAPQKSSPPAQQPGAQTFAWQIPPQMPIAPLQRPPAPQPMLPPQPMLSGGGPPLRTSMP